MQGLLKKVSAIVRRDKRKLWQCHIRYLFKFVKNIEEKIHFKHQFLKSIKIFQYKSNMCKTLTFKSIMHNARDE